MFDDQKSVPEDSEICAWNFDNIKFRRRCDIRARFSNVQRL